MKNKKKATTAVDEKEKFLNSNAQKRDFVSVGQHVRNLEQTIKTQDQIMRAVRSEILIVHRILMDKKVVTSEDLETTKNKIIEEIKQSDGQFDNLDNEEAVR